jgi:hypothetical protein
MAIQHFEPLLRAIEIMSPQYGTGYRIGGHLVLTVAHPLGKVGSVCQLRSKRSFGEVEAKVVWRAQTADIALLELPNEIAPCEAIVLGKLPQARFGEIISFKMYGYPWWGRTERDTGTAAGGRQIEGMIYLADTSPDDFLVLEPKRVPEGNSKRDSEWEGASGAAIVCDGLVVGVQRWHQNPNRPASIEAEPLSKVYSDEQWCSLLIQHGINPNLETVSVENGTSPPLNLH